MKKTYSLLYALLLLVMVAKAEGPTQPFLFSVNTLTAGTPHWGLHYSGSYGERTLMPVGYDGADQQLAVKGYLGNRFTLIANAALGFSNGGGVRSAQQAEVIRDFFGGRKLFGPRIGLGLGLSRDWTNDKAIFSRITAAFDTRSWRIGGNMRFEKVFASNRDGIDLISSIGFQHHVVGGLFAGVEAVGEDLEGFWEMDEAEGGAKLLVGPSLNFVPANSWMAFAICGGPIFYATRSSVAPSEAIRDLASAKNGYTVRAQVTFNLHK